ncbi:MAG: Crp/Fnr family transcriptional regulator [Oscillochloridaceae bacterium]|nr:Crp/Fnr family transcriptional regulator [Chloroflexaceae bacterium]MDW8389660.1 Crp/Fnr family transcriptional regulator [Oscillochloridaceae bacterium]
MQATIAECPFCAGLEQAVLCDLAGTASIREVDAQRFIFHEHEPATTFYILMHGQALLSKLADTGQQVIIRAVKPLDAIGVIASLSQTVYPLSARAILPCTLLAWDHSTLTGLMDRHPVLALRALRLLAGRFADLQHQYLELATQRVERRIAHTLLRLMQQVGQPVTAGTLVDLPLSRQQLAEMSGTTLYTASRVLSRWAQQGIVVSAREQVIICDPHRMMQIADSPPA